MTKLSLAEQNWYRDNLTRIADSASMIAEQRVTNIIQNQLRNNKFDIAQIRNETIEEVKAITDVYTENAKALSVEFFDYIMELEDSTIKAMVYANDFNDAWIDEQIRYLAGLLTDEEFEEFVKRTGRYAEYLVRRSSFINLLKNVKYNKVKFGRIAVGKTCAFCLMLSSRGFVYATRESAGDGWNKYHKNCDCLIVPSTDGSLTVEGYDYDDFSAIYSDARKSALKELGELVDRKTLQEEILRRIRQLTGS